MMLMTSDRAKMHESVMSFYGSAGRHTDVSRHDIDVTDARQVVEIVQGLVVYDLFANDLYGVELPVEQMQSVHERDANALLKLASSIDPSPLEQPRTPAARIGGRCNTYTLLTVALLRAAGIPARSRCGFATYFVPGWYEDHWVAEYWSAEEEQWVLVDPQLDETWRDLLGIEEDGPVRVGPEQFLTGGHAWRAWRSGHLDADRCGLTSLSEHGAFWIASNLRLDFAALNKVEMLPWDIWGLGWEPPDEPSDDMLSTFDSIAELAIDPDRRFHELRERYESDASLRMDGTVFSAALGQQQQV